RLDRVVDPAVAPGRAVAPVGRAVVVDVDMNSRGRLAAGGEDGGDGDASLAQQLGRGDGGGRLPLSPAHPQRRARRESGVGAAQQRVAASVDVDHEAGGGQGEAEAREQLVVAPAGAEREAEVAGEELE